MKLYFHIIAYFVTMSPVFSQDLGRSVTDFRKRWNENPVQAGGSVGLNASLFESGNENTYQNPFSWNIYGNVNFDVLGIQVPLGFFYAQQNKRFNLPSYRFVGISPSYEGYTLHLGDRNMQFSPYSFSNTGFSGIGGEYRSEKIHAKAMYGRIQRATIKDINTHNSFESAYRRMAWGGSVDYKFKQTMVGVNLFHASDDESSIPLNNPDSVLPQKNTIIGLKFDQQVGIFFLRSEFAHNILTRNKTLENEGNATVGHLFQKANNSTGSYQAFKAALEADLKILTAGIDFEHIDPGYESLGALFFNNDMQTMAAFLRLPLFKNKLQTQLRGGLQRNNLNDDRVSSYKRWTTAATINYQATSKTGINLFYNNFRFDQKTYLNPTPFLDVDTVFITQNNLSTGLGLNQSFNAKNRLFTTINFAKAVAITNQITQNETDVTNFLFNTAYALSLPDDVTANLSYTYNNMNSAFAKNILTGPTLQVSKAWTKDVWTTSLTYSWFGGTNNEVKNNISRVFLSNNLTLAKKLVTTAQMMFSRVNNTTVIYNDFFVNLGLTYTIENKPLIKSFNAKTSVNEKK